MTTKGPKTTIRYRAHIRASGEVLLPRLHPTRGRAVKEAIDALLRDGVIEVDEVEVRKHTQTLFEEME